MMKSKLNNSMKCRDEMSIYKQQREQVNKAILDTSIKIFKEKGYENATIHEITKEVGIAKGTFYNYYSSKSEILISWATQKFQAVDISQIINSYKGIEANLTNLVEQIIELIRNESVLFQAFLKEILKVHNDSTYNQKFDFKNLYLIIINNSNDTNQIGEHLLDVKIEVLNNALFMGMINWFDADKPVEGLKQHLIDIVHVCIGGILKR